MPDTSTISVAERPSWDARSRSHLSRASRRSFALPTVARAIRTRDAVRAENPPATTAGAVASLDLRQRILALAFARSVRGLAAKGQRVACRLPRLQRLAHLDGDADALGAGLDEGAAAHRDPVVVAALRLRH